MVVPKKYSEFEARYNQERGISPTRGIYLDDEFFTTSNGLQQGTGGQLGSQHGYQNGDPSWAGEPQGKNVAGANRALASPFGVDPFAQRAGLLPDEPIPESELRDDHPKKTKITPFKRKPY